MRKVTVRLPASITNIGPGTANLGLALGLYTQVEISERAGNSLIVETAGEGAGSYSIGLRHPVALALMRVFQRLERAPLGVHIRVDTSIPLESGLGAEATFWVAGIIGAYNLLGQGISRSALVQIAAEISPQPGNAVTALLGGLTASFSEGKQLIYRSLPVANLRLVVVLPQIENYNLRLLEDDISRADAEHNLDRLPLLVQGFQTGEVELIRQSLADRIVAPAFWAKISGQQHIRESARLAGAAAVTLAGRGPALIALAEREHEAVAEAMISAFANTGVQARSWIVPIDTQGVVISAMQSG